jgi:hypothetical protein
VRWLQDNLDVEFPQQSEILSISLSGDDPSEEQRLVVNAVAKAYMDEVIYARRQKQLATRDALARSLDKLNDELNRELNDFYDIARELGVSEAFARDAETDLLIGDVAGAQKKKSELEGEMIDLRTQYAIMNSWKIPP